MQPLLKPEIQAKFLRHLNQRKKADEGFTLIELLVVVIIIGVLAAIALPSLLGQVNKAKQAEAKQNIGTMNRAEQAYYLEYQNFASTIVQLGVGIRSQTDNYSYSIDTTPVSNGSYVQHTAKFITGKQTLKSYYGMVGTTIGDTATSEALTIAIACESPTPGIQPKSQGSFNGSCADSFVSLAR